MDDLRDLIRTIPDFPKPGILFRDVTTLIGHKTGFHKAISALVARYKASRIDAVAGIEARGFILGSAIAYGLGVGFIPLRKKGKLPGEAVGEDYALEYGTDRIEMHVGAVNRGERVLLVDDLIATGGTAGAAIKLLESAGAVIVETCFLVDLPDLKGAEKIRKLGHNVFALVDFEGH
jgi:adenine phosphoribosyltransferase